MRQCCRKGLEFALIIILSAFTALTAATSADGVQALLDPAPMAVPTSLRSGSLLESATGDDGVGFDWLTIGGDLPLVRPTAGRNILTSVDATHLVMEGDVHYPSGKALPENLTAVTASATARQVFSDNWIAGIALEGRMSSDGSQALSDGRDADVSVFVEAPLRLHESLVISGSWATQRIWLHSRFLPGIAWQYAPDDSLWLLLGFPVAYVFWQPTEPFSIEGGLVDEPHASIDWHPRPSLTARLSWDWHEEIFRSAEGGCTIAEMRASAGCEWVPKPAFQLEIMIGTTLNRRITNGVGRDLSTGEYINVGGGQLIGASVAVRF